MYTYASNSTQFNPYEFKFMTAILENK